MSEYIKREDMLAIFSQTRSIANAMESFMHLPSADVREVVHGEWIDCGWSIKCSECDYDMPFAVRNFCPNCGADMRGKDNE